MQDGDKFLPTNNDLLNYIAVSNSGKEEEKKIIQYFGPKKESSIQDQTEKEQFSKALTHLKFDQRAYDKALAGYQKYNIENKNSKFVGPTNKKNCLKIRIPLVLDHILNDIKTQKMAQEKFTAYTSIYSKDLKDDGLILVKWVPGKIDDTLLNYCTPIEIEIEKKYTMHDFFNDIEIPVNAKLDKNLEVTKKNGLDDAPKLFVEGKNKSQELVIAPIAHSSFFIRWFSLLKRSLYRPLCWLIYLFD